MGVLNDLWFGLGIAVTWQNLVYCFNGCVLGTLVGAFIMGLLANGSDLLGTNPYWQQVIIGAVIILAVSFDELRKRKMTA